MNVVRQDHRTTPVPAYHPQVLSGACVAVSGACVVSSDLVLQWVSRVL